MRLAAPRARGHRPAGLVVTNVGLRVLIVVLAVEALLMPADPRFANTGIAVRDLILAGAAITLIAPLLHLLRGRRRPYPLVADTLVLSIIAVDLLLNHFDLYNQPYRFDLIAHGYGPAAAAMALISAGLGPLVSVLVVNLGHVLFEVQEAVGDVVFATHNVRSAWDTVSDLGTGLVTSGSVAWLWVRHRRPTGPRDRAMRHSSPQHGEARLGR